MTTPSLMRLACTRRLEGVSAASTELLVLSAVWWVAYAVEIHNIPTLVSSTLGLVAPSASMVLFWRMGALSAWAKVALVGGLALVPLSLSHPDLLGSIAALAGASLALPQALTLLCHPDRSAAGVSATSWAPVGCNGALWLTLWSPRRPSLDRRRRARHRARVSRCGGRTSAPARLGGTHN